MNPDAPLVIARLHNRALTFVGLTFPPVCVGCLRENPEKECPFRIFTQEQIATDWRRNNCMVPICKRCWKYLEEEERTTFERDDDGHNAYLARVTEGALIALLFTNREYAARFREANLSCLAPPEAQLQLSYYLFEPLAWPAGVPRPAGARPPELMPALIKALIPPDASRGWHLAPDIPPKKVANAIAKYAPDVSPADVLALLDNTVFGSAKTGLLLTAEGFWHNLADLRGGTGYVAWDEIHHVIGGFSCVSIYLRDKPRCVIDTLNDWPAFVQLARLTLHH